MKAVPLRQGRRAQHDIRHVVTVEEMVASLFECVADFNKQQNHTTLNEIPIKIATGPGKHQVYLISSIYYSPETQTIFIDAEN